MKFFSKTLVLLLLLISATSALAYFFWYKPKFSSHQATHSFSFNKNNSETIQRLKQKALIAAAFAKANNYNTNRFFFIDMKITSGLKRFFVYDLEKDSIEMAGLVAHGSGSDKGGDDLYFSNTPNSNCTALGKYKIGRSYMGKFGLAYKLYGLDNTNSKAFERFIVLHAHPCVPNDDVAPLPICESWGCPTVDPAFLSAIKSYIDKSERPVLLWIYY